MAPPQQPKPEPSPSPANPETDVPEPIPGDPQPSPDQQIQDPPTFPEHDSKASRNKLVFDEDKVAK
jgi:hypothetical protein